MKKYLSPDQKIKIKAAVLAGGGYPEMADRVVEWVCEIVASGTRQGRPPATSTEYANLLDEIDRLKRRNPHIKSKSSIAAKLGIDRRKITRAMADPQTKRIRQWQRRTALFPRLRRQRPHTVFDN